MIIKYISKNFDTKDKCIKALMSFYLLHKDTLDIDEIASFNAFVDLPLGALQINLSTMYLFIDTGKTVEALQLFEDHVKIS